MEHAKIMLDFPRSGHKMILLNNIIIIHLFPPGLVYSILLPLASWCRLWDEALWYKSQCTCYSFHCSVDVYSMIVNAYSYCDITWNFFRKFAYYYVSLRFNYLVSYDVSRGFFFCVFHPTDLNDFQTLLFNSPTQDLPY